MGILGNRPPENYPEKFSEGALPPPPPPHPALGPGTPHPLCLRCVSQYLGHPTLSVSGVYLSTWDTPPFLSQVCISVPRTPHPLCLSCVSQYLGHPTPSVSVVYLSTWDTPPPLSQLCISVPGTPHLLCLRCVSWGGVSFNFEG